MKKAGIIIGSLVVLSVTLWLGWTFYIGSRVATGFEEEFKESKARPGGFKLKQVEYEKGLFSSRSKTLFWMPAEPDVNIPMNHQIYHGPLAMTPQGPKKAANYIITTFDWKEIDEKAPKKIKEIWGDKEPVTIYTTVGFDDTWTSKIEVLGFKQTKDGQTAEFGGMEVVVAGKKDQLSSIEGIMKKLSVVGKGEEFVMDKMTVKGKMEEINDYIMGGSLKVVIPNTESTSKEGKFAVRDVEYSLNVTNHGDALLKGGVSYKYGSMKLPESMKSMEKIFGNGAELTFAGSVDLNAITKIVKMSEDLSTSLEPEPGLMGDGSEIEDPEQMQEWMNAGLDLFQPGLAIGGKFMLGQSGADSGIKWNLQYGGKKPARELKNVGEVVKAFGAGLRIEVDNSLLDEETAAMLEGGSGGFVKKFGNEDYRGTAVIKDGKLIINGEVTDFVELMGEAANEPVDIDSLMGGVMTAKAKNDEQNMIDPFATPDGVDIDPSPAPVSEVRTWTNTAGKTMEARFVGYNATRTAGRFVRTDGHEYEIPLSDLSPADRAYLSRFR